jgi:hypothetical protein
MAVHWIGLRNQFNLLQCPHLTASCYAESCLPVFFKSLTSFCREPPVYIGNLEAWSSVRCGSVECALSSLIACIVAASALCCFRGGDCCCTLLQLICTLCSYAGALHFDALHHFTCMLKTVSRHSIALSCPTFAAPLLFTVIVHLGFWCCSQLA